MKNFNILKIKSLGPTEFLPCRVSIQSPRFKQCVAIPWDNEPGEILDSTQVAEKWLQSKGFDIVGRGEGNDYSYIITNTFEPLKP